MTQSDLEYLKSHIDQRVKIDTRSGEHLLIKVISVFDEESDPNIFFWDVTSEPEKPDSQQTRGYSLPLDEIIAVKPAR